VQALLAAFDTGQIQTYQGPTTGPAGVFGLRRLSILDLSSRGRQPMSNQDGMLWITYNGEVYNYRELRDELRGRGYIFRSDTDTEAILHGYEEWGDGVVGRLRGMFAFGILDLRAPEDGLHPAPRFFAARDRFGMKPFYYAEIPGGLLFASELKGLLASGLVSPEVDAAALPLFLVWGSIPAPKTFYRGIRALPPGHFLHLRKGELTVERYWNLADCYAPERRRRVSVAQAILETRAALMDSIKAHLVSDVPVGAFLSGGIDSSAIVALMREAGQSKIKTVSVVFPEAEYNESQYARLVAQRYETEHVEVTVSSDDLLGEWDRIFAAMDQPTVDGVNTYFVAKATHEAGLKVALSGLGGDELFGGYGSFRDLPRLYQVNRWLGESRWARQAVSCAMALCFPQRRAKLSHVLNTPNTLRSLYLAYRGVFMPGELDRLLPQGIPPTDFCAHLPEPNGAATVWDTVSLLETGAYMASQLLRDTDVFSMAHSLETRIPFVDDRLLESVLALPRNGPTGKSPKALLSAALGDRLPEAVVNRPKMGFAFPFDQWLRKGARKRVEELLHSGTTFPEHVVTELWGRFLSRRLHWSRVWALAVWTAQSQAVSS